MEQHGRVCGYYKLGGSGLMLQFRLNNEALETTPDGAVEFHFQNPALETDFISGSYTLPFTFPVTPKNERIFEFSNKIETRNKTIVYDGLKGFYNKILKLSGKLVLTRTSDEGFVCSVSLNGFTLDALDKSLKDVDYGDDVVIVTTPETYSQDIVNHANVTIEDAYPDVNYDFPVMKNASFYGSSNLTFEGIVNQWDSVTQTFLANFTDGVFWTPEESLRNHYNLSPQLYNAFVLEKIIEGLGYKDRKSVV
jgi:hypothetical protein